MDKEIILNKEKLFFIPKEKEKIFLPLNKFDKHKDFKPFIDKKIDFRDRQEKRGLWEDADLIRLRKGLFQDEQKLPLVFPAFEPVVQQVEIIPGHVEALAGFLSKEQQRDPQGHFRYLLTSGLAVEVITGVCRYHHDIDLVIFDYRNAWWKKYLTDNVTADRYWAEMKFDPAYLEEKAWIARFQTQGVERTVATIHPAIILVQKLSNAWGRPPRERDFKDVAELVKFWQNSLNGDPSWNSVIETAIAALPQAEQARTRERLAQYN